MFLRLLWESFARQRRRKLLAGIAILLGTTAVTAMLALATTLGDRLHKELAVFGANIIVTPKADHLAVKIGDRDIKPTTSGTYLKESDLLKLKTIFWANNITGLSPELPITVTLIASGKTFPNIPAQGLWFNHPFGTSLARTGAPQLHPAWRLTGSWPLAQDTAAIGTHLAASLGIKPGDAITIALSETNGLSGTNPRIDPNAAREPQQTLHISGIANTGTSTDDELLLPLATAQRLAGLPNAISRVEISARTKPEDAFARADPDALPPRQREIWYCRPYANSIAYQIREVIPAAAADQVRKIEQSEGTILQRIGGLMWLIAAAALLSAGFAVSAAMATAILERRAEIGLMRSLGASKAAIALLFYAETGLLSLFAGTLGYLLGSGLAAWLGARIFADPASHATALSTLGATPIFIPVLLPIVVATALLVALAGSTPSIRNALRMDPSTVLRADA